MPDEPLIVKVLHRYYPGWELPKDTGREWLKTCCPFHGDTVASAGVSYRLNGFRCMACGYGGSAIGILMEKEGVTYSKAVSLAEAMAPGSNLALPGKPARKPRREFLGEQGAGGQEDPRVVPSRVRERPLPWA